MKPDDAQALRRIVSAAIRHKNDPYTAAEIDVGRAEVAQSVVNALEDAGWKLTPPSERRPRWWFRWLHRTR